MSYAQLIQPSDPDFDPEDPLAERACEGCGFIAVFNLRDNYLTTLQRRGKLNAPWGMVVARKMIWPVQRLTPS
ncbi:MAG: hypothetical protein L0220_13385 [Acidobacteria bacterium]|nr:hypothetical protein [Acidobacteriota bacterium]